jgi:hypothetical protein
MTERFGRQAAIFVHFRCGFAPAASINLTRRRDRARAD